ncbi:aminotransferase class III-fold pyridoxal phosphate-dependent enzyme [candidate division KSB3 bacterium]|uniref:Aminotransferase class III-fold pyridoxal phosphate-dependent enzyme n=1 Tax=candidate division KSB3 bacterium TaxID=2044937 RepID=A0A9D5JY82_9BACT|nr:aminotransferase class III-fold pyridoxal phosphate-dependent enzyme [candidate division KSB3 bacterium]MBD3326017.1 aminotransferase class III-fold pyridoxal phosphate-dependent enzyme [candidate division KSB3 bacterium]
MQPLTERQIALLHRTFLDYQQTSEFIKHPLLIEKAEGLYYWDTEGKRYFDAIGGIFVAILGHRHPRLVDALHRQLDKLTFAPPLHGTSPVALDFVEKIGTITPENLKYVKSFSGGSEAVESALKFVRQYFKQIGFPHKYKFISRYYGYHGATFGAMGASGTGKRKTKFEPQMAGFLKVFPPNYYRDQFSSWEECNRFCARMFEDVILHEDPETVAGIIIEPIGNTGGIITPTDEYFQILRDICDRHHVMLIYDEIITGFGKTGSMFAAQTFDVTPDLLCTGKGISSGMLPMGAMIAREDMAEAFYGAIDDEVHFAHGHTFAGNPLASAVGIAVIEEIVEQHLCEKARELGDYLTEKLEGLKQYGVIREVRGKGILRGVELVKDTQTMQPFPELGKALKLTALSNGLIMRIDPSWFAVSPALVAEKADIDEMCELVEKSLVDALEMVQSS